MKLSEILRALADIVDSADIDSVAEPQQNTPVFNRVTVPNVDKSTSDTFVPPLQAKIELLKKAVDVDSIYDKTESKDPEIARIKKMAGINPVVADEAASDEPLDS